MHKNTNNSAVIIIGSGPAGLTAAIYAARAGLNPILFHGNQPGGQLTITTLVENYPGFAEAVQGPWLMQEMIAQAEKVGTNIISSYVSQVDLSKRPFEVRTSGSDIYTADSLIISTGAESKWLGLDSERKFRGYGVSSCATCDAPFFKNADVLVIGGGNTAVEEALHLAHHARKVTVVHRRDSFRAEKILQERLFKNPKISVLWNHNIVEICGNDEPASVTHVIAKDNITGKETEVNCEGVFIAIGHKPNTDLFKGQLEMDQEGYIITKPGTTQTSVKGVFAAGDVQDKIFRQAVTAAGSGCMAALEVGKFLLN